MNPNKQFNWHPEKSPLTTRWAQDVTPENVHTEYPRPQMERKDWLNLNGLWQFEIVNNLDTIPSDKTLPDNILVPFPIESGLSGIMKPADYAWYKRIINIPDDWSGKRVLLHFGAIDWEATIYLNGSRIGSHRGGYDPFY